MAVFRVAQDLKCEEAVDFAFDALEAALPVGGYDYHVAELRSLAKDGLRAEETIARYDKSNTTHALRICIKQLEHANSLVSQLSAALRAAELRAARVESGGPVLRPRVGQ